MVRPVCLEDTKLQGFRGTAAKIVENSRFVKFIALLILINAITMGMETNPSLKAEYGSLFKLFDGLVLSIFIVELGLKIYAYRLNFFRVGWNVFDFIIVAISMVPHGTGASILRSLRILRLFRLITLVPQMRNVVGALLYAIPGMTSIIGILVLLLYVSAVLAVQMFGQSSDPVMQGYFGSVGNSMHTMFQLMTLEDWPDIAGPTMEIYPWSWMFFVPYIIIITFAILNLFIGIIVDALHIVKEQDLQKEEAVISNEIDDLKQMLQHLQKDMDNLHRKIK